MWVITLENLHYFGILNRYKRNDEAKVAINAGQNHLYWATWPTTGEKFRAVVLSRGDMGDVRVILKYIYKHTIVGVVGFSF